MPILHWLEMGSVESPTAALAKAIVDIICGSDQEGQLATGSPHAICPVGRNMVHLRRHGPAAPH